MQKTCRSDNNTRFRLLVQNRFRPLSLTLSLSVCYRKGQSPTTKNSENSSRVAKHFNGRNQHRPNADLLNKLVQLKTITSLMTLPTSKKIQIIASETDSGNHTSSSTYIHIEERLLSQTAKENTLSAAGGREQKPSRGAESSSVTGSHHSHTPSLAE